LRRGILEKMRAKSVDSLNLGRRTVRLSRLEGQNPMGGRAAKSMERRRAQSF
jgi:hypothetical protein